MLHDSWKARLSAALVLAVGIATLVLVLDDFAAPPTLHSEASLNRCDRSEPVAHSDAAHAVARGQAEALVEPAAICRIRPECNTNADCDEKCGVGLGRCVHSNCPIRICRCR